MNVTMLQGTHIAQRAGVIEHPLGEGGMAAVCLAHDLKLGVPLRAAVVRRPYDRKSY